MAMRSFHRTDKRTWSLLDDQGAVLGSLVRTKWHGMGAEIAVAQGIHEVRRMKGFTSKIAVFADEVPLLIARFGWKGITITDPHGQRPAVTVRREHLFSSTHVVSAEDGSLVKVRLRMSWKHFELQPELVAATGEDLDPMVLLFAVYAIQLQQRRSSAAAA
jgi:hypothetical protein